MKKFFIFLIFFILLPVEKSHGLDVKGLQPVDPYGVFSTFGTDSLPKGKYALSAGAEVSIDPDLYRSIVRTAFGVTDSVELMMTLPYTFGSDVKDGFEDVALGIKHRFFNEGKYGPSFAYIVNGSLPTGSDTLTSRGRYGIGLLMSKKVGPVNGHLNLFYEVPGKRRLDEEITFLAGLDFAAAHHFKFLAELACRKGHESEKVDRVEARAGYRVVAGDFLYTTFGVGFDLKNRDPETRIMFSATAVLPKVKRKLQKIYEEEE